MIKKGIPGNPMNQDQPGINSKDFTYYPLTSERWQDFERLFAEHGIQNGFWCMSSRSGRTPASSSPSPTGAKA
jgi:hypothetical protein